MTAPDPLPVVLPDQLARPNDEGIWRQPVDLWHPRMPDLAACDWPEDWGARPQ